MTEASGGPANKAKRLASWFRAQDFAWVIFVGGLIAATPDTNYQLSIFLVLIGAFQIVEPRLKLFSSRRGQITSIVLKLVLSYFLVGYTHSINSYYYSIFLIPVVSAATIFDLAGVVLVTAIAGAAYCSFLLPVFVDWNVFHLEDYLGLMCLRVSFWAIVAFLVYEQARAKRDEMLLTKEAAAGLAESNKNLREAQVSLRRNERLAALGQLTAGLAHELRNPLGTIKASAEMLMKESVQSRPAMMAEMAEYIDTEVNRMNGLITSFLNFARPLQIHPAPANLRVVVEDVLKQQAELAKSLGVEMVLRMDGDRSFQFDPDLLKVALANLVQNAIQASTSGQRVEIRVQSKDHDVLILISDTGAGIQRQHLESIFNPFFTTKPQGIGLGLPIVAKIIDEHGGRIQVFSEAGKGTRFEVTLPTTGDYS
ncbi:MAG TPA: ATP-binding protein [Bryobacteraceae bacterium]|nr:ATP-binding protein [Bryobacteraceae bacterium]